MTMYLKKVVLSCPTGSTGGIEELVEDFISQGVTFVAVVGEDCARIEDIIDEIVVGDGTRDRFILTSSHPNETVADAVRFAKSLTGEYAGEEVQVVEIV
jgi:predicted aldo/keto reductase-like oxidoreductase